MKTRRPASSYQRRNTNLLHLEIPAKANKILHIILIMLLLIVARIWYLSIVEHEHNLELANKPKLKSVLQPAVRATIRDRFNYPLAINKVCLKAAILYSEIRDIPSIKWVKLPNGQKVKAYARRQYIKQLSQLLGKELSLSSDRIEDLIHSKAALYTQMPFVIKDEISEKEYYRLRALSRSWPGIHVQMAPQRFYPKGKCAADIIGYMGSINKPQFENLLLQMQQLKSYIQNAEVDPFIEPPQGIQDLSAAEERLKFLQQKSYSIHDYVGKTGIEKICEEDLRGFYGKQNYYSDSKGNFLWQMPGSVSPIEGKRILLTLSIELQEYAEQLLAQNESLRLVRKSNIAGNKRTSFALKSPWIKGGAIVAMEPSSGEILSMASFPRFDPNDFISSSNAEMRKIKTQNINQWFESDIHLADVWNLQKPLERERFDALRGTFYDEKKWLTWENYLQFILVKNEPLYLAVSQIDTLGEAVNFLKLIDQLKNCCGNIPLKSSLNYIYDTYQDKNSGFAAEYLDSLQCICQVNEAEIDTLKEKLQPYFQNLTSAYEKVLLVDLCQLAVAMPQFDPNLEAETAHIPISSHRLAEGAFVTIDQFVQAQAKKIFKVTDFKTWKKEHSKEFLKQKRLVEKSQKKYARPYLDYYDAEEKRQFDLFWQKNRWALIATFLGLESNVPVNCCAHFHNYFRQISTKISQKQGQSQLFKSLRALKSILGQLSNAVSFKYLQTLRSFNELDAPLEGNYRGLKTSLNSTQKGLAAAFYPRFGFGFARSHAFRQATIQGSLFKIVTAYAALVNKYQQLAQDLVSEQQLNPLTITESEYLAGGKRYLGKFADGTAISQMYKGGRLPRSLAHKNIGKIDIMRALEYSSNPYFALLAADHLEDGQQLLEAAKEFGFGEKTGISLPGEISGNLPQDISYNATGLYSTAIGQHSLTVTPLQTATMLSAIANKGKLTQPKIIKLKVGKDFSTPSAVNQFEHLPQKIKHQIFMPDIVRSIIMKSLQACTRRTCQENLYSLQKIYRDQPEAIKVLKSLQNDILGKTSTSESVERVDLDPKEGVNIYTHVWFGAISLPPEDGGGTANKFLFYDRFGQPELVVVVYLRFGGYGKEAAPLAAQIIKKWREIKQAQSEK